MQSTGTYLTTEDAPQVMMSDDVMQTDADTIDMVRRDHHRARIYMAGWYTTAQKCYDYIYGTQAPKDQNIFYLVLNLTVHRFLTKVGILTAGKPIASISGRDTDDDDAGQVMKDLVEYGIDRDYLDASIQDCVQDQIICGLGVLEERYLVHHKRWTEKHGWVPGKLVVTVENPMDYAFDPRNATEKMDGENGAKYYTKISKVERRRLQLLYPKKAALIGTASSAVDDALLSGDDEERTGGTYNSANKSKQEFRPSDELTVIEYWYKKSIPIDVVLKVYKDEDGTPGRTEIARLPTEEEIAENPHIYGAPTPAIVAVPIAPGDEGLSGFGEEVTAGPEEGGEVSPEELRGRTLDDVLSALVGPSYPFAEYGDPGGLVDANNLPPLRKDSGGAFDYEVFRTFDEQCWTAAIVGNVLLYHRRSPYRHNRWPAVFFAGMMRKGHPCPYGQIEPMIVPQDVINSNMTLIQDIAQRVSNPGRIIKPDALIASQKNRVLDIVNQPGWVLVMDENSQLTVNDVYREIAPGQIPGQLLEFTEYIRRMIDEIGSVAQVQRGGMPYDTSGKAIQSLLQASDTALSTVHRNIEYAVTVWAENRVKNIQQFYALEDSLRISDDLRAYRIAFEYYTNPETEKTTLSLVKYPEGEPGKDAPPPKRIFDDFGVAEFDIEVGIHSNQERNPDEESARILSYFDRGIVDKQYVIENDDWIVGKREVLRRVMERDETLKTIEAFNAMMQDSESPAGMLIRAMQNPQVSELVLAALSQGGLTPEALAQVVAQAEAGEEQAAGIPAGAPTPAPRTGAPPGTGAAPAQIAQPMQQVGVDAGGIPILGPAGGQEMVGVAMPRNGVPRMR